MREKKLVYVPMAVDTIHPGHLNIIKTASGLGQVMVGLFTDEAIASYKRIPVMNYEQRKIIIENIKGVDLVVKQETRDYEPNLRQYKPDYMIHGTDWREGPLAAVRSRAIEVMNEWGGVVVEPEYTKGVSSSALHQEEKQDGVTSEQKRINFNRLLAVKKFSRMIGVYNGRTAQIAEHAVTKETDGVNCQFDALWLDVEGLALQKGVKASEISETDIFTAVTDIHLNSNKPLIIPFRGGNRKRFLRQAQQSGAAAIAVWDSELSRQKETIAWFLNHRNYQNMMIMVIADKHTIEKDTYGAEGIILKSENTEEEPDKIEAEAGIPLLIMNDTGKKLKNCERISGIIYGSSMGRLADFSLQKAVEIFLKADS